MITTIILFPHFNITSHKNCDLQGQCVQGPLCTLHAGLKGRFAITRCKTEGYKIQLVDILFSLQQTL